MRPHLVVAALLLTASLAHAQSSGFELGVRGSFQTPFGSINGVDMGTNFTPGFGLELEVGARVANGHISLLAFGGSGAVWTRPPSDSLSVALTAVETRFGGELLFRPFSSIAFQPWAGIGIGAESFGSDWGLIFTPQAGLDLRIGIFGLGPYIEVPFGTYLRPVSVGSDLHGWFNAGLRISFAPRPD